MPNKKSERPAKHQNKKKGKNTTVSKTPIQKEFDKFRHEIYKLGLTGLDKKDQIDARYELAIKLGAKPKKWIKPNQGLGEDNNKQKQQKNRQTHHGTSREISKHPKTNTTFST